MKRAYIPGDKWLYYKIYCGPRTADELISEVLFPCTENLKQRGIINKWFFIRYSDPDLHVRVRFYCDDILNIGYIMQQMNVHLSNMLEHNKIWKVLCDTYQPELERYHPEAIGLGEQLFHFDSICTAKFLGLIEGDEGEKIRWMFAFRNIDSLLSDFGFNQKSKFELIEKLKNAYAQEFGMNKSLKLQLDTKFRGIRSDINHIMSINELSAEELVPVLSLLKERSIQNADVISQLEELEQKIESLKVLELMPSYIHMLMNRLFRSKQRVHEMVVYDFLWRYYKSDIAKKKYSKVNAKKKKACSTVI